MKVFIVFGLGLGDNEDAWEVCAVTLTEADAQQMIASQTMETGCEYKYEAWDVK